MPSSSRLSSQLLTRAMTFGRVLVVVLASLPMAEGSCLSDNQNNLHTCAQQCSEKDRMAACVSDCLIDLKVPSTCASCLGTQVDCGRRFCAKECSSGNSSSSCLTCLDTQCSDCSKALNFESHSLSDVGPDFTKLFLGATSEEADGPVRHPLLQPSRSVWLLCPVLHQRLLQWMLELRQQPLFRVVPEICCEL